jgi:hypothetical protein
VTAALIALSSACTSGTASTALRGPNHPLSGQAIRAYGHEYDIATNGVTNTSHSEITITAAKAITRGPIRVEGIFVSGRQAGYNGPAGGIDHSPLTLRNGKPAVLVPVSSTPRLRSKQSVYLDVRARLTKSSSAAELVAVKLSYRIDGEAAEETYSMPYSLCASQSASATCRRSMALVNRLAGRT